MDQGSMHKSSLWGAIKGALFEDPPYEDEKNQAAPAPAQAQSTPSSTATSHGTHLHEMTQRLTSLSMGVDSPYTRLLHAAGRLESVIPDEAARLKGALAVTDGICAADVLSAIDQEHMSILDEQVKLFNSQSTEQTKQEVDRRMTTIEGLKQQVAKRASQAEALRKEMADRLAEMGRADEADTMLIAETMRDADAKRAEIEQLKGNFHTAVEHVRGNLQQTRQKLAGFLGA